MPACVRPLLVASVLVSACGGDPAPPEGHPISSATALAYEGIYALSDRTYNEASCDAEGPPVLAMTGDRMFVLASDELLGSVMVAMFSCPDHAGCLDRVQSFRQRMPFDSEYGLTLTEEPTTGALTGFTSSTGFLREGVCTERRALEHLVTRRAGTVTLETRTRPLPDRPPDEAGLCATSTAGDRAAAASAPCTSLEVLTGQRVADP
jgi:hypothetical protein